MLLLFFSNNTPFDPGSAPTTNGDALTAFWTTCSRFWFSLILICSLGSLAHSPSGDLFTLLPKIGILQEQLQEGKLWLI